MGMASYEPSRLSKRVCHDGTVDTVVVAMVDMQGRLQGKRLDAHFFLDETLEHGTEGCNYLLAVDVEMNTVGGYRISSWETGYGDFVMIPDLSTLRAAPWEPGCAWMLADVQWLDGRPVMESPRQILRRQLDRLAERGWVAYVGTELEFNLFDETYESAWTKGYSRPDAGQSVQRRLLDPRHEPGGAGAPGHPPGHARRRTCRSSQPRGNATSASTRSPSSTATPSRLATTTSCTRPAAKEIAAKHGKALTFMAKFNEREGNSCHVHLSLRTRSGEPIFAGEKPGGLSPRLRADS